VIGHGEATIAWGHTELGSELQTEQVAHGPLVGAWRPAQALRRASGLDPFFRYPHLAISPTGAVLMTWNGCSRSCLSGGQGVRVAWRQPGRGFAVSRLVGTAPLGASGEFDSAGTAYLTSGCSGRVLLASGPGRPFGKTLVFSRVPVSSMTLSLSGPGEGLATWIEGACSFDEAVGETPGPVLLQGLRHGSLGPRHLVAPLSQSMTAIASTVVATPQGGEVSWFGYGGPSGNFAYQAAVGRDAAPGTTEVVNDGLIELAADGAGDVLWGSVPDLAFPSEMFMRTSTGAEQRAPASSGTSAIAPFGRSATLLWRNGTQLELSVWHP
jgi:hypothetical protein